MVADRERWNALHKTGHPGSACYCLQNFSHLLPDHGTALDVACGKGGNSMLLAAHGLDVASWDVSDTALAALKQAAAAASLDITTHQIDISSTSFSDQLFDVIVVSRYLDRSLFRPLTGALRPGGLLFYETFTAQKSLPGGPQNPDFLLTTGELLKAFSELQLLEYHEDTGHGDITQGLRNRAYLIAAKPGG